VNKLNWLMSLLVLIVTLLVELYCLVVLIFSEGSGCGLALRGVARDIMVSFGVSNCFWVSSRFEMSKPLFNLYFLLGFEREYDLDGAFGVYCSLIVFLGYQYGG